MRMSMSHPMWVCGLKHTQKADLCWQRWVTPHVGVWIETWPLPLSCRFALSHPMWVCGLKLPRVEIFDHLFCVTPHVGVWIETIFAKFLVVFIFVTPHVGVWIETDRNC